MDARRLVRIALAAAVAIGPAPRVRAMIGMEEEFLFADIPPVTIAAKHEESLLSASGTVYVVTDEDIRRYGYRSLKDILSSIPGMEYRWSYEGNDFNVRGFKAGATETIFLVDGREMNLMEGFGISETNYIPIHNIKRVEVLMGPNSALYGGHALDGVINVVTANGDESETDGGNLQVVQGMAGTQSYAGYFKKTAGDLAVSFSGHRFSSDQDWKKVARHYMDRDGYSRTLSRDLHRDYEASRYRAQVMSWNYSGLASYKGLYAGFHVTRAKNDHGGTKVDYQGHIHWNDHEMRFAGWKGSLGHKLDLRAEMRYTTDQTHSMFRTLSSGNPTSYQTALPLNRTRAQMRPSRRPQALVQANWRPMEGNTLVAGYDWWKVHYMFFQQDHGIYPSFDDKQAQRSRERITKYSVFVQDTQNLLDDRLKLTVGARFNHETRTQDSWLPRASLVFQPNVESAIKLTYGQGFRGATPDERSQNLIFELRPQIMDMYELNYTQTRMTGGLQIINTNAVFHMQNKNVLKRVPRPPDFPVTGNANVFIATDEKLKSYGAESQVKLKGRKAAGHLGLRWVRPDKSTPGGTVVSGPTFYVEDIARFKAVAGASWRWTSLLETALSAEHRSRVKSAANLIGNPPKAPPNFNQTSHVELYTAPAFTVYNLNVTLGEFDWDGMRADFGILVENVLDKKYYVTRGAATDGFRIRQTPRHVEARATVKF